MVQISISGLDPDAKYIVVMDIVPVDDNRYSKSVMFVCVCVYLVKRA